MRRIALLVPPFRFHLMVGDELKRYALKHPDWIIRVGELAPEDASRLQLDAVVGYFRTDEAYREYRSLRLPIIALFRQPSRFRGPCILQDNVAVARMAADYFASLGLRQFGFAKYPGQINLKTGRLEAGPLGVTQQQRLEAFLAEARRRGIPCSVSPDYAPFSELWRRPLETWLATLPKPVGILCVSDSVCTPVLEACYLQRLSVPEQVSVLGVDNDPGICALSNPTVSSIAVALDQLAGRVGSLLEAFFKTGRLPAQSFCIKPTGVVERASTAPVAPEDPLVAEALAILRRRAYEPINIKEVLSTASHSRRQFDRQFHSLVGRTPYEELCRLRVDRAKNLLRETRQSLTLIAASCGFSGTTHMRRVFMTVAGFSPQDCRARGIGPVQ
ncbi:MAG: substrate-binding domain-containing protein [Kiritimatiellia bacterium]|nr:substrate-binding domain-containing protein [Kiritimatiellia bacterium]